MITKEKEHIQLDCTVCSGVQADIKNLNQSDTKQWDALDRLQTSKASSSQMRWVIGIFLLIALATVGTLWRTQTASTDKILGKIESMEKEGGIKREETNTKLDGLKEKVNELKWSVEDHIRSGGRK